MIFLEDKPDSAQGGSELSFLDLALRSPYPVRLFYRNSGNLLSRYQQAGCRLRQVPISNYRFFNSLKFLATHSEQDRSDQSIYVNHYQNLPFAALYKLRYGLHLYCHLRLPPPQNLGAQLKLAVSLVDRFFAVSHFTQRQWQACFPPTVKPNKITTIYNGVCPQHFVPINLKFDCPTIFFAARNVPEKGISSLIRAMEFLPHHYRLLVLGRYSNYCSTERIRFIGQISRQELPIILARSHIAVMPSEWPEPFGKVLIEAMACNVPAIASDIGGIPEVLPDSSYLFPARNPYQLATTLRSKIQEQGSAIRYRDYVLNRFDIENQTRKVFEKIKEC